ncbi:MAG: response regulator [Verrucomicrobiae bacterium]|nr:response regulator [Verrucomicrobiae bacterium]
MKKLALIIDDDADFRRFVADCLSEAGWEVAQASDGETGLELARARRPDAVVCDLLMPRGNGFQVCRTLRADPALRDLTIVVTSGRTFPADRDAALEAGADAYLTKPFSPGHLLEVLARPALARGEGSAIAAELERTGSSPAPGAAVAVGTPPSRQASASGAWFRFWGVRGSVPAPGPGTARYGGNTSCVEVRAGGQIIILDAGTGLRPLGRALMEEFGPRPLHLTLLLTHTHWDHIQGLPFFRPLYEPQCRLRILGYEGARQSLVNVLTSQMESPYFPVPFEELPANVQIEELRDMAFELRADGAHGATSAISVRAHFANHPGVCVGYRLDTTDGALVFFPDNEPWTRVHVTRSATHGPSGTTADVEAFARAEEAKMIEFMRGAEALILDAQYDATEYPAHVGWGHGSVESAVALALRAGIGTLFLFHHDPEHDDATIDRMVAAARERVAREGGKLAVEAAQEGVRVELATLRRGR